MASRISRYIYAQHKLDIQVDLSTQVLEIEGDDPARRGSTEPLHPTLKGLKDANWAPAMAFALKAKAFDDGLYAAVDLLAQQGTPLLPGKRRIVEQVHQTLLSRWRPESSGPLEPVLVNLRAALSMTGTPEEPDARLQKLVARAIKDFESEPRLSKPLGFYTWSSQLRALFKQDRLLQKEWKPEAAGLLLQALQSDEHQLSAWRRHLQLLGRLTNPLSLPALDEEGEERCFFPPSDSHEEHLLKELFPNQPLPEGFQLVDELISRIRSGKLDTSPTSRSGWYDHQLHALVPFLMPERMPEAERLIIGRWYRNELEQQFRGQFALTRETHSKQLRPLIRVKGLNGRGDGEPRWQPLYLAPRLSLEPLAEFYGRRAQGYAFLRQVLLELLGGEALANARRVLPTGLAEVPLLEELEGMEQLFRGAHAVVRKELGFGEAPPAVLPAVQVTEHWLRQWKEDPDLSRDPRCVVPLFFDAGLQKTKVTAFLGFHFRNVTARFERCPEYQVKDLEGRTVTSAEVVLTAAQHLTVIPVTAELYVDRVPDRAEFQALCDKQRSPSAILEALRA